MPQGVRIDITGQKFGRITVTGFSHINKDRKAMWTCSCECGSTCIVAGKYLRNGRTRSCGCLRAEMIRDSSITHGHSKSGAYQSWLSMHNRCYNQKQRSYKGYGALGIKVCDRWMRPTGFPEFLADMGERPDGMTLDRKNPFGDYTPDNCKWSTHAEQAVNQKRNIALAVLSKADPEWFKRLRDVVAQTDLP